MSSPQHPIVMALGPSEDQWPAITPRGSNVLVTAGAGAGKTRTLVARYLARLAEGVPLRAITAITFTRKAAREMRNRVRLEIGRYLARSLDASERSVWMRHQAALDAARIGTIHNLCMEILRAHPAEAGIDPRFDVLDEARMALMRDSAIDAALAWAASDAEVEALFEAFSEDDLRDLLHLLLGRRLDVHEALDDSPDALAARWREAVVARLRPLVGDGDLTSHLDALSDIRAAGDLDKAEAAGDAQAPHLRTLLAAYDRLAAARRADDWATVLQSLLEIWSELKPGKGAKRNWRGVDPKPLLKLVKEALEDHETFLKREPSLEIDALNAQDVARLRAVLTHAQRDYEQAKRESGALDFDDLEAGALTLLQTRSDVRARWRGELREIMVDEFQDTNPRQRDLLACLNGEAEGGAVAASDGKLFVVGDAKQSIYRFRGADVSVFRAQRSTVRAQGVLVDMATSYRAHAKLVHAMNDLVRPVMGDVDDAAQPWREPFAPLKPFRSEPGPGFDGPPVELHLTLGSKNAALGQCARAVAARVLELVRGGAQVRDGDGFRALRFDDVAVLCRAGGSFGPYEDAFEVAGVPFLTVAGRGFYERPEVRDVLNQLRVVHDPADDIALAGLLRSPAFGVSDAGLYQLRADGRHARPLWDVLGGAQTVLTGDDLRAAERARLSLGQWRELAGRVTVGALLKRMLDDTLYRAILLRAGKERAARNLAKLLSDAVNSNLVSVSAFLEYIGNVRDSGTREGEARATSEGAVQIMSVHAAKGLEWPVVIIGDVGYEGASRMDTLIERDAGILLSGRAGSPGKSARYCLAYEIEQLKDEAESARLFYVAATRAQELLILSGAARLSTKGELSGLTGWLGALDGSGALALKGIDVGTYDEAGAGSGQVDLSCGASTVRCHIHEPNHVTRQALHAMAGEQTFTAPDGAPGALLAPLLVPLASGEAPQLEPVRRATPASTRAHAPAWLVGTIVHEVIAGWRLDAGDVSDWLDTRARANGLIERPLRDDAVRRAERALQRFRAHPVYGELTRARKRLHEVPYAVPGDAGVIDVLYETETGWQLLDFKTDVVRDVDELPELVRTSGYADQIARYARAAGALLGAPVRARLCFLDAAGGVVLYEST